MAILESLTIGSKRIVVPGRILMRYTRSVPVRANSTASLPPTPGPPLLLKLRADLKTAMRAKDASRLNVLRALLAEVTNAAKTKSPIKTDSQLLSILRKKATAAKTASDEFKAAGRQDLVDKEVEQMKIMDDYAGSVETMSENDIRSVVGNAIKTAKEELGEKATLGEVLKRLFAPGGDFDQKPVERAEVAKMAKEMLAGS